MYNWDNDLCDNNAVGEVNEMNEAQWVVDKKCNKKCKKNLDWKK